MSELLPVGTHFSYISEQGYRKPAIVLGNSESSVLHDVYRTQSFEWYNILVHNPKKGVFYLRENVHRLRIDESTAVEPLQVDPPQGVPVFEPQTEGQLPPDPFVEDADAAGDEDFE